MARTKRNPTQTVTPPAPSPLYYRLHALLQTIRVIKTCEDPLCTLLHAIQNAGATPPEVAIELKELLDLLPSSAFAEELHAVRDTLHTSDEEAAGLAAPTPAPQQPAARKRKKIA